MAPPGLLHAFPQNPLLDDGKNSLDEFVFFLMRMISHSPSAFSPMLRPEAESQTPAPAPALTDLMVKMR